MNMGGEDRDAATAALELLAILRKVVSLPGHGIDSVSSAGAHGCSVRLSSGIYSPFHVATNPAGKQGRLGCP